MSKRKKKVRKDRDVELAKHIVGNHGAGPHVDRKRKEKMKRKKITSDWEE